MTKHMVAFSSTILGYSTLGYSTLDYITLDYTTLGNTSHAAHPRNIEGKKDGQEYQR